MVCWFLQSKMCASEKSGTSQRFCAPDQHRARNLSRPAHSRGCFEITAPNVLDISRKTYVVEFHCNRIAGLIIQPTTGQ